jgi:hypothetical protein
MSARSWPPLLSCSQPAVAGLEDGLPDESPPDAEQLVKANEVTRAYCAPPPGGTPNECAR